ncbi:MAG: hypothetical protein PVG14_06500 [Anaerolineales bacterium]|jgi:hypothetical protein
MTGSGHFSWAISKGANYQLDDGAVGEVRVYKPYSHRRVTWKPSSWMKSSTFQVRVIPKGDKTVIAFHQEHLPSSHVREQRRAHFKVALDRIQDIILI